MQSNHVSVLLNESVEGLAIHEGDVIVDGTLGAGGHSAEIARRFGNAVQIVGFDLDAHALVIAKETIEKAGGKLTSIHDTFAHIEHACVAHGIPKINKALFDLGVSSMELGASGRGFSFMHDEPLLMTLKNPITSDTLTAGHVVNGTSESELADIIYQLGEERYSRMIAKAIVTARRKKRIETTFELKEIVWDAVPRGYRNGKIHPATKTFQALRMYVNDELGAIEQGLRGAWNMLETNGRIAVITFHSLEDRVVKNIFKEFSKSNGTLINKKPIVPTREEVLKNRRSRSAKLRIIQKN